MSNLRWTLVMLPLALAGCPEDKPAPTADTAAVTAAPAPKPSVAPTATAKPTAAPAPKPPAPTATATASAAPPTAEPAAELSLLQSFTKAKRIKIRRLDGSGEGTIEDPDVIAKLLAAVDLKQKPQDACPRCMATIKLVFEDDKKTRLGSFGLFCGEDDKAQGLLVLRDALSDTCQTLKAKDFPAIESAVNAALPAAK